MVRRPAGWRIGEQSLARGFAAAGLAAWAASVLLAFWLAPSAAGFGTHTQLGLGECSWRRITGQERCPSCGLTTAAALWYRDRFTEAVQANGLILYWIPVQLALAGISLWLWRRPTLSHLWWMLGAMAGAAGVYALIWLGLLLRGRT